MAGSTTGFGIEVGPQVKVGGGTLPPMFSRSWQDRDEVGDVRKFFEEERGSVSITQAVCLTHRIDIADTARKELLNGFNDNGQYKYLEDARMGPRPAIDLQNNLFE